MNPPRKALAAGSSTAPKPLKRPRQARARFTVQAIYDAFVRIWQRDGWDKLTTRNVALETGISVGTLYDYFPNKTALLSGYVRHCIESLLAAIDREAVQPTDLPWTARVHHLVRLVCGVDAPELPPFHPDMLALEAQMAEPRHHRRVHEELVTAWGRVFAACSDLPCPPGQELLQVLHLSAWGGRRYVLLLQLDAVQMRQWAEGVEQLCCAAIRQAPSPPD
ncbi:MULTISPECIES: TetR/AcrR family transcriptional regulator [Acidovorax]|uniref:TetR/AcrR family transcriptional regulator n=1 Tax=Acidovorax TaxID=12916 RepID=UPI0002376393|nr:MULTISPECIES: TetR/AcrR family transcriptional regulator [Acidovorax]KRD26525.1 TetR family transcriptional regulator [Acidovorax sp. Root267]KRD47842.1 TetR family transcriptional regulator [Acidovorax sp. Root275]